MRDGTPQRSCTGCGYRVTESESGKCPECGRSLGLAPDGAWHVSTRLARAGFAATFAISLGAAIAFELSAGLWDPWFSAFLVLAFVGMPIALGAFIFGSLFLLSARVDSARVEAQAPARRFEEWALRLLAVGSVAPFAWVIWSLVQ